MSSQAYVGSWYDYSQDAPFLRWTLTLTSFWGALLTPALVILVNFAGSAVWTIAAFALHQYRAREEPIDALELQLDVLLRNAPSPILTVWALICLAWTWNGHARRARTRILTLAWWPLLIFDAVLTASIFVAKIQSGAGKINNVLKHESGCGLPIAGQTSFSSAQAFASKNAEDVRNAAARVDTCRSGSGVDCTGLPIRHIDYSITSSACPFTGLGRCVTDPQRLTTEYINSNKHLGINAPREAQVDLRIAQTCSVLSVRDRTFSVPDTSVVGRAAQIWTVFLGSTGPRTNFTFAYPTRYQNSSLPYTISTVYSFAGDQKNSVWQPDPDFNQSFADVTAHLVSANSIRYLRPVSDRGFAATGIYNDTSLDGTVLYLPDHYFSIFGCTEQWEYRSVTTNSSTGFLGYKQAYNRSTQIGLNDDQAATVQRIYAALFSARNSVTIAGQGPNALQASKLLDGLFSSPLANNQSQIETLGWFETGLANLQYRIADFPDNSWYSADVEAATGLSVKAAISYDRPTGRALNDQCKTTRIQSTGKYVNYLLGPLVLVVVTTVTLILLGLIIPCSINRLPNRAAARDAEDQNGCFGRRRKARPDGTKRHKYRRWVAGHYFSLARAAVGGEGWKDSDTTSPYRDELKEGVSLIQGPVEREKSIQYVPSRELDLTSSAQDSGYQEDVNVEAARAVQPSQPW